MLAHKLKVRVPENHELLLRLPEDFPPGEAEVIVLATRRESCPQPEDFKTRLGRWVASLPPAPDLPLEAFDREHLYP